MNSEKLKKPLLSVLAAYVMCFIFRFIEYFFIQTDRTFWGEAFLHKLVGIAILCVALKGFSLRAQEIGFTKGGVLKCTLKGLAFALAIFAVAYSVEFVIIATQGGQPSLQLYVSSYAVDGNVGNQTGISFFGICIIGNIINVVMEEGMFRGLFQKLLEQNYKFIASAVIASLLFGFWHVPSGSLPKAAA